MDEHTSEINLHDDVEAHGLALNENEDVVEDDDVEAHRLALNENEDVVADDEDD